MRFLLGGGSAQAVDLPRLRRTFVAVPRTVGAGFGATGTGSALAWAHAAIGEAIHNSDSNRSGAFMAFPGTSA
jgi:hypothetical protein